MKFVLHWLFIVNQSGSLGHATQVCLLLLTERRKSIWSDLPKTMDHDNGFIFFPIIFQFANKMKLQIHMHCFGRACAN